MSPPRLWFFLCETMWGASAQLAQELWPHVPNLRVVGWELSLIEQRAGRSYTGVVGRTKRLALALSPQALLAAALAVEPEGTERSKEIRYFETNVLRMVTPEGTWRW